MKRKPRISYRKGWLRHRISTLTEPVTIRLLVQKVGINERTIRRWLQNDKFIAANVASFEDGRWVFDRERLWLWMLAIRAVNAYPDRGDLSPDEAAEELGIEVEKRKK